MLLAAGCQRRAVRLHDDLRRDVRRGGRRPALFKLAPTTDELPAQGLFVPLNADGTNLPSDWYLRVTGEAGKMLRGEIPQQSTLPIRPEAGPGH